MYKDIKKKKPKAPAKPRKAKVPKEPIVNVNYVNGCRVDLLGWPEGEYQVTMTNKDTFEVLHRDIIGPNAWTKCYYQYFINYEITVSQDGKVLRTVDLDLKDQKVLIGIESSALGDTLAWMPYAEEFRKKHGCKVALVTYMNDLFRDTYPDIEFVEPGVGVSNIRAQYNIGWFYRDGRIDLWRNPVDPKSQPMQKTASDILGLEFKEVKPILSLPNVEKEDTVCIGIHSTAQVKYWNNPTGWQEVVDHINGLGFKVLLLSREKNGHNGNYHPDGIIQQPQSSIKQIIRELCKSKLYVGIGSGLTWLAWACNVPIVLVSGYSEPYTEMQPSDTYRRIGTPKGKRISTGSFNKYKLDPGDWYWYEPKKLRDTERQFECSKSITSEPVIKAINELLDIQEVDLEPIVKVKAKRKTKVK